MTDNSGLEDLSGNIERPREVIRNTLDLNPKPETILKMVRLQGLLEKELPVRRALRAVRFKWKSYYNYAPSTSNSRFKEV